MAEESSPPTQYRFDLLPYRPFVIDCPGAQNERVQQTMIASGLLGGDRMGGDMIVSVPTHRHRVMIVPAIGVTVTQIERRLLEVIAECVAAGHIRVNRFGKILCE